MKYIFGAFLGLSLLQAIAGEIRVKKMVKDGELERSFILQTNLQEKVVIDCQSFIQGLRIGEYENAFFYMMDPNECESLQGRIRGSLRKLQQHCIDVDQDIRADYACQ
ncbi:hypothetical protein ACJVC5_18015 [Peredibacter sp. HCB2-198]|uniref:hypothetical protein n=1 Tax=Peredibacter sp. HCB2-198 TaxID=3383025 RepID=UPI0038B50975